MNFATPWAFLLVIPWLAAAWFLYRSGKRGGTLFPATRYLPARTAGWRVWASRLVPPLFLAGSLMLIAAAARPRFTLSRESRSVDAIAIGMVVDVSGSMEGLDLTPEGSNNYQTRLEVVKDLFTEFVEQRPDDLIGLVTFGGYASTRSPLTADHRTLIHVLKGVEVPQADINGDAADAEETMTAIGDGLATGIARLTDAEPKTRIIILLSDGESNTGIITPEQAADAAAKVGIKVYAIGVGSNRPVPFKTRDMFGRETIGHAHVTFNEAQLKQIASKTGGRYFGVRDHDGLSAALEEINQLETTKIEREIYDRYDERFVVPLVWGAVLAALAVTLNMGLTRRIL
ncbi:MAG: VWA domain-containing protein [Kiritimatiellae bacterium]|nr:VWA domain-containing protein [Kiritimatiellia bacterium]